MKMSNSQRQQNSKGNFARYLPPSSLIQPKAIRNKAENSNIHCRSMQDLDLNANMIFHPSISKENIKSNIHHSSLFNQKQNGKGELQPGKSKSLSKFISFFQNSNLLKTNHNPPRKDVNESKRKNYNGFCYDLKIAANSTVNNKQILKKKDKQNINYQTSNSQHQTLNSQRESNLQISNRSPLITKKQKNPVNSDSGNYTNELLVCKMKDAIEEYRKREAKHCQRIGVLENKNKQLQSETQNYQNQIQSLNKKHNQYEQKIRQLEAKNKQFIQINRNFANKEPKGHKSTRQQDMVIKSLKKVISQQLNKIIELQRVKFQNQYLRQKIGLQEDQSFSQISQSNHEYSFENQNEKQNNKSSSSSSSKLDYPQSMNYGKEIFKKSKPIVDKYLESEKGNFNGKHFKSFFQIQESPISQDGNVMSLFKPLETRKSQGRNESNRVNQKNQGSNMIKIAEAQPSFSRETIEEIHQENYQHQNSSSKNQQQSQCVDSGSQCEIREEQDSILEEVDQYLMKWRNHS